MVINKTGSLVGSLLVRYGPNQGSKLFGLWIFVAYASGIPISLSMISSNVAGFTKKAVVSAMLFIAYCVGNIIGPFLFFPDQAPIYEVSCARLCLTEFRVTSYR
jgi:ACS family allantoate permease-like MFS transporter